MAAFINPILPGALSKTAALNMKPNKPSSLNPNTVKVINVQEPTLATKPTKTRRGKRGQGQKTQQPGPQPYTPPEFVLKLGKDSDSSSSSDSFSSSPNRTIFYDDSRGEPVKFDYRIEPTVMTQQLEAPQDTSTVWSSKFIVNLAKYHRELLTPGVVVNSYVERQYNIIFTQMSRDIVKTIRSKIVDKWTFVNFHNAIQVAIKALSLFYTLDSIQSYSGSDVSRDKNVQNLNLQKIIEQNPQILYLKDDLRRSLKGVWIPPMLSGLIRWTYQLFKTADLDQATNYRFIPFEEFIAINSDNDVPAQLATLLEEVLNQVNDPTYATIWSILSQVYPEGEIVGLPLSCCTAVYDHRHAEVLANQPVLFEVGSGTLLVCPYANNPNMAESFVYAMNTNVKEGSGLPFVLQTMYDNPVTPTIDFLQTFRFTGATSANYRTNKFALSASGYFVPRIWNRELVGVESPDVHVVEQDGSLNVQVRLSCVPSGFQAVYFDIVTAPLINLREFMSDMFGV